MPYINAKDNRREALRKGETALTAGELNYQIFYFVKHACPHTNLSVLYEYIMNYVDNFLGEKPNYQKYNDMTGALIRCKKELERRLNLQYLPTQVLIDVMEYYDLAIAKYEDKKILENGDVE